MLCKDKFSILASLCSQSPPLEQDEEGVFFVERDWWVFRYILQFLRNDTLPRDSGLLEEMYTEASFYRLNSLRRAIEVRRSEERCNSAPWQFQTQPRLAAFFATLF